MTAWEELNATVWATIKPSNIHGVGVFAIRDIPMRAVITNSTSNFTGKKQFFVHEKDFQKILPEIRDLILNRTQFGTSNTFSFNSPNVQVLLREFMNHSEEPNSDGVMTIRDIKKGEEITENYKAGSFNRHKFTEEYYSWLK